MGKNSMWFFQKISLGMAIVNAILMALADSKITMDEIVNIVNTILQGFAEDVKLNADDLQVFYKEDGSIAIMLSADLVAKMSAEL